MTATQRRGFLSLAIVGGMACLTVPAWAQQDFAAARAAKTSSDLGRLLAPFGIDVAAAPVRARGWKQIQLDWTRPDGDVAAAFGERASERRLAIRKERTLKVAPARRRALELSEAQILVVATDSRRQLVWWTAMPDPRFLRAETIDEEGNLTDAGGRYRGSVALHVEIPNDRGIEQLEIYHPRWNGAEFELEPLGAVARAR
jgi:hypothetical protein